MLRIPRWKVVSFPHLFDKANYLEVVTILTEARRADVGSLWEAKGLLSWKWNSNDEY